MASLNDIVNVTIALQTAGVARGEFGVPLIAAPLMDFPERVRVYTSYQAVEESTLPLMVKTALKHCFSQTPRPRQVKLGRRSITKAAIVPKTVIPSGVYSFKVGAKEYTFTATASPTADTICTGLAAAITADAQKKVSGTAVTGTLELTWVSPTDTQEIVLGTNLQWGTITPVVTTGTIASDLAAINAEDPSWYGLVMQERSKAVIVEAASWVEASEKLFATASADSDILDAQATTDVISTLKNTRYFRTAIMYHANAATEYPDAALMGRVFTIQPGAETWALKSLAGITPTKLSATQRQTVFNKGGNAFEFYQSQIALTNPGKTAAGEFIDVIRFRDWLKDTIQVNMVQMMINRDKVPYTDPGIQLCANNLRRSLQEGQNVGGIAPDEIGADGKNVPGFIINVPLSMNIAPSIKASRKLTLSFAARLAGAIHLCDINGSLTYEL